jgi:hypothetical protein
MKIQVHKSVGMNLLFFLETFGFKCLWEKVNQNWDVLHVLPDERNELLASIKKEVEKSGHVPYHFSILPQNKGEIAAQDADGKVNFKGKITQVNEFKNISGGFRLVLFECESGNNYLWKSYKDKPLPPNTVSVTGRAVCKLNSLDGGVLNLFNYARMKEV